MLMPLSRSRRPNADAGAPPAISAGKFRAWLSGRSFRCAVIRDRQRVSGRLELVIAAATNSSRRTPSTRLPAGLGASTTSASASRCSACRPYSLVSSIPTSNSPKPDRPGRGGQRGDRRRAVVVSWMVSGSASVSVLINSEDECWLVTVGTTRLLLGRLGRTYASPQIAIVGHGEQGRLRGIAHSVAATHDHRTTSGLVRVGHFSRAEVGHFSRAAKKMPSRSSPCSKLGHRCPGLGRRRSKGVLSSA